MSGLDIHLFGFPHIERDGVPAIIERRKTLALLAYLAVTRQPHGRDALAALLWPESDQQAGHGALRSTLVYLRQAIGKEWLNLDGDRVGLRDAPGLRIDVEQFHNLVHEVTAHNHPPRQLCEDCLVTLTEATDLYHSDFLTGFTLDDAVEFDAWESFQTESLRLELAGALEMLAQGLAGRQQWEPAIGHARRWLALDPLNEAAHRLLIQLYAWAGDRAASVRQYQECVKVLREELDIEPEPQTTAIFETARSGADTGHISAPLPLRPAAPIHNLPTDQTSFIGRKNELAQIAENLADPACRLLTVIGSGGIGKTRLALQAARAEVDRFAHGTYFIDLAPLTSAEYLAPTILRTLNAPQQAAGEPDQYLLDFLHDKEMLLVLDNYEHLLTGSDPDRRDGYGLVTKVLATAPQVKLLVTSRSRLNVTAEWLTPLDGMPVPTEEGRPGIHVPDLQQYSAAALFLASIHRLRPDFSLTLEDARHIAHICRMLEGTPLAIELAATWIRTLTPAEIAGELAHGLDLLTTTLLDVSPRHRSMIAAFDHSWRLLKPHEQSMLRQLSVFRGGFTQDAAEAVAGGSLADLVVLADASWIRMVVASRYGMHELTRQYCAGKLTHEHLEATGESAEQVYDRHAAYYKSLLQAQSRRFYRHGRAVTEIAPDVDNLLVALDWMVTRDDLDATRTMALGLMWIADRQGWQRIVAQVLDSSAQRLREHDATSQNDLDRRCERVAVLATVLMGEGALAYMLGMQERAETYLAQATDLLSGDCCADPALAESRFWVWRLSALILTVQAHFTESMQVWQSVVAALEEGQLQVWPYDDDSALGWQSEAYLAQGSNALHLGQYREACRLAGLCISLSRKIGGRIWVAYGSRVLAMALMYAGDFGQAEKQALASLKINRAMEDRWGAAWCLQVLCRLYLLWGRLDQAHVHGRRSLSLAEAAGLHGHRAATLSLLGDIALAQGRTTKAGHWFEESLELYRHIGAAGSIGFAYPLLGQGQVALAIGDLAGAKASVRHVLGRRARSAQVTAAAILCMADICLTEGEMSRSAELCAFLSACPATSFSTRQAAARNLDELATRLPSGEFAAACERGRAHQIDEVATALVTDF